MNKCLKLLLLTMAIGALNISSANAATATANLLVTAKVNGVCTITGATLDFGTHTPTAASFGQANITANCTKGLTYTISLDAGQNGAGTGSSTTRAMKLSGGGTDLLNYNLYSDTGYTTVLAAGTQQTSTGSAITLTAYGKIPSGQYGASATSVSTAYNDTVIATITYP